MAILVDEAIWPWRGLRWAHLVSDSHLDELHDFAHRLGMPYLAFQGDHYDIHTEMRLQALANGARAVPGRELVTALRHAGLRRRGGIEPWRWEWEQPGDQGLARTLTQAEGADLEHDIELIARSGSGLTTGRAVRSSEAILVVSTPAAVQVATGLTVIDPNTTVHRSVGERGTYVEWRRSASMPTNSRSSV